MFVTKTTDDSRENSVAWITFKMISNRDEVGGPSTSPLSTRPDLGRGSKRDGVDSLQLSTVSDETLLNE